MIKISKPIIVEGKYDKIRLKNIVEATIIETNGFRIFKDKEKRELIKILAEQRGIIVMTDSDSAGRIIRNYIKSIAPNGNIVNVLLPSISGTERRKRKSSSEGLLGVEGTPDEIIIRVLNQFCTVDCSVSSEQPIAKKDLYNEGLFGGENSSEKRRELCKYLSLPQSISVNGFLEVVNLIYGRESFGEVLNLWRQEDFKN